MARTVRDANLETRTARLRLPIRSEPYWRGLERGFALGYRRRGKGGTWLARRLRMPSAVLSALRWFGLWPGLERASAGFAARPRCQSSILFAVSLPTITVPSAGRMWVSAARWV